MKIISTDQYNENTYDPELKLYCHTAKPGTTYMTEADFKEMLLQWKKNVFDIMPTYLLVDNRLLDFPISPDLQEWIKVNIGVPATNLECVKKLCYVMPEEFIANLSMSQYTDEHIQMLKNTNTQLKYFNSVEEAKAWLLE